MNYIEEKAKERKAIRVYEQQCVESSRFTSNPQQMEKLNRFLELVAQQHMLNREIVELKRQISQDMEDCDCKRAIDFNLGKQVIRYPKGNLRVSSLTPTQVEMFSSYRFIEHFDHQIIPILYGYGKKVLLKQFQFLVERKTFTDLDGRAEFYSPHKLTTTIPMKSVKEVFDPPVGYQYVIWYSNLGRCGNDDFRTD